MPLIISSKGKDFRAWRAADDFALTCRQLLLEQSGNLSSDEAEALFLEVESKLERLAKEHQDALEHLGRLTEEAAAAGAPERLRVLVDQFYLACYAFFTENRSATAFYRLSQSFLAIASQALIAHTKARFAGLPDVALVALGPAGRQEFSPFCRLHLMLVHGEVAEAQAEQIAVFAAALHDAFETAGLRPDTQITPRNPAWRGSLTEWSRRLRESAEPGGLQDFTFLARLTDQCGLVAQDPLIELFRAQSLAILQHCRPFQAFLVTRVMELSTGIGIMGGFRVERKGGHRGLFALLDHALLPLSASIGTMALIREQDALTTTQRLRDLLSRSDIDVEMAERLLDAWFLFHEVRLQREAGLMPERSDEDSCYIDVQAWSEEEQERFKEYLEYVETLQRHVGIIFSSRGEV